MATDILQPRPAAKLPLFLLAAFLGGMPARATIDHFTVTYQPFPDPQENEIRILQVPVLTYYPEPDGAFGAICLPNRLLQSPPEIWDKDVNLASVHGISVRMADCTAASGAVELDLRQMQVRQGDWVTAEVLVTALVQCILKTAAGVDWAEAEITIRSAPGAPAWTEYAGVYDVATGTRTSSTQETVVPTAATPERVRTPRSVADSVPPTPAEDDEWLALMRAWIEMDALDQDVCFFLRRANNQKRLKDTLREATVELGRILAGLRTTEFRPETASIREAVITVLTDQQKFSKAFGGSAGPGDGDRALESLHSGLQGFPERVVDVYPRYVPSPSVTGECRVGSVRDSMARAYLHGLELYKQGEIPKALAQFSAVLQEIGTPPLKHLCLLKTADCYLYYAFRCRVYRLGDRDTTELGLEALAKILDDGRYSPVLTEAFLRWRTAQQSYWHGVSNYSEIPNREYNLRRFALIAVIRDHLRQDPGDSWARRQLETLALAPNIGRGYPLGNTALRELGVWFTGSDDSAAE